jgi:hypothetical protein
MKMRSSDDGYLLDAARERAGDILMLYKQFEEKKPVMVLELPAQKIYAYPYLEFKNTLSARSQRMLEREYEAARANRQLVVFVRDEIGRRMISFSVDEAE